MLGALCEELTTVDVDSISVIDAGADLMRKGYVPFKWSSCWDFTTLSIHDYPPESSGSTGRRNLRSLDLLDCVLGVEARICSILSPQLVLCTASTMAHLRPRKLWQADGKAACSPHRE